MQRQKIIAADDVYLDVYYVHIIIPAVHPEVGTCTLNYRKLQLAIHRLETSVVQLEITRVLYRHSIVLVDSLTLLNAKPNHSALRPASN